MEMSLQGCKIAQFHLLNHLGIYQMATLMVAKVAKLIHRSFTSALVILFGLQDHLNLIIRTTTSVKLDSVVTFVTAGFIGDHDFS